MSKKQQYTTKFYEDNGGGIQAVTRDESGKVVNVLGGFEADPGTGLSVLAAATYRLPTCQEWDEVVSFLRQQTHNAEDLKEALINSFSDAVVQKKSRSFTNRACSCRTWRYSPR